MPFLSWTTTAYPSPEPGMLLEHDYRTQPCRVEMGQKNTTSTSVAIQRKDHQLYHEQKKTSTTTRNNINHPCIAACCSIHMAPYLVQRPTLNCPNLSCWHGAFAAMSPHRRWMPKRFRRLRFSGVPKLMGYETKTWFGLSWFVMDCPTKQIMVQHFFHIKQKQEFWFVQHRGRDLQCLWITVLSLAPVWLPSQQTKRKPTVGALSFLKKCSIVLALGCLHFTIWLAESETSWLVGCDHQSPKSTISWMLYHDPSAHLSYCFVIMTFVICLQLPWLHGSILARDDSIASPSSKRGQSQWGTTRWPVLIAYLSPSPSQIWT